MNVNLAALAQRRAGGLTVAESIKDGCALGIVEVGNRSLSAWRIHSANLTVEPNDTRGSERRCVVDSGDDAAIGASAAA